MGKKFSNTIIQWHQDHPRPLAWKKTKDPYHIWLSEIILQQTRVEQGTPYYLKFIRHYPTVADLAKAPIERVLKDWEGLGYYSRARNLHATAQYIHKELHGVFPNSYTSILQLKGIGPYTAAAIASFAFDLPHAVLDGNVFRVLARYFGIFTPIDSTPGKKEFQQLADELLPPDQAALYNQAIMNFGALHCTPKLPKCSDCPLKAQCYAWNKDSISFLPSKKNKLAKKDRFFNYFVITHSDKLMIHQREQQDIWKGLYEFPLIESNQALNRVDILNLLKTKGVETAPKDLTLLDERKQTLSHRVIKAKFFKLELNKQNYQLLFKQGVAIERSQLSQFAFPVIIRDFLGQNKVQSKFLF